MNDISVVIPVYGCPQAVKPLCERLVITLEKLTNNYEIILVNDGCPKNSWANIVDVCKDNKKIVGINLSRNFGQVHATNAGLNMSTGEYVVVMDCDLQDPPEAIETIYKEIIQGYDIVFVKRSDRKDNPLTLFLSKMFYKVYNHFVDGYYDGDIGNYCIVKRKIVDEYNAIKDQNKSFTTVLSWMGYKTTLIEINGEERFEGKSSYNLSKKINLAIDMITSQSNKPLKLMVKLGVSIAVLSFIFIIYRVILFFMYHDTPEGWTTMVAAVFLMGGITLVCLGVVGIYIGNIFNQTKNNPEYLISEVLNVENK